MPRSSSSVPSLKFVACSTVFMSAETVPRVARQCERPWPAFKSNRMHYPSTMYACVSCSCALCLTDPRDALVFEPSWRRYDARRFPLQPWDDGYQVPSRGHYRGCVLYEANSHGCAVCETIFASVHCRSSSSLPPLDLFMRSKVRTEPDLFCTESAGLEVSLPS
jgi:hypothetical protein